MNRNVRSHPADIRSKSEIAEIIWTDRASQPENSIPGALRRFAELTGGAEESRYQ
jgi:hypothetical protein